RNAAVRAAIGATLFREKSRDPGRRHRTPGENLKMSEKPQGDLRVSLIQGDTLWHDPEGNRARYGEMMAPLRGQTDLIVLPETFTSGFSNEAIHRAEGMDGPTVAWLREQAKVLGAVVTGSVQIRE